jgi:hypothetical protein
MHDREAAQGLAEYAMGLSLVAILAVFGLALLGPAVSELLDTVGLTLGTGGAITGVIVERTGHGQGNTVHITVGVRVGTSVSVRDDVSGETMGPVPCRGSCLVILAGVGPEPGTVTVTTLTGHSASADYAARP